VSLIGWSLGGVMSRELAKRFPQMVRQVVTLGSPFGGNPRASYAFNLYRAITGHDIDPDTMAEEFEALRRPPPRVPTTAIYSKTDGVVAWRNCVEQPGPLTDNIEVYASHCGLGVNPAVFFALADRLALPETDWQRFDRSSTWRRYVYPSSGH
jgi:pimeloyl-ACP methyl ester carboxylesterase